ncbi:MAG TPA: acyl-CoA dehydratase activase-related protein [Candidatus Acidoferrum sp.]|nr:acyl-CoA dehydratase activase-related protein [Candidatus Acidoferrum sp.]
MRYDYYSVGIDIGSTTVKVVVMDGDAVVYERYERHMAQVRAKTAELLAEARRAAAGRQVTAAVSGSAGMGLAKASGIPFIQEVFATGECVRRLLPDIDVIVELGGEDAKILFLRGGEEQRMNGACAGGTGAFIDQMATLLGVTGEELDRLSLTAGRLYPIASRCGVFAKSDIQPLLNSGADHGDIAASIFQAVVDQSVTGLAQGRRLEGNIAFLGGPLYYYEGLRRRFIETLPGARPVFPEWGRHAVAMGAAMCARDEGRLFGFDELLHRVNTAAAVPAAGRLPPLFETPADYEAFIERHAKADVARADLDSYDGPCYLGIDCGSTTTKLALIDCEDRVLISYYGPNLGDPVAVVLEKLHEFRGRADIAGAASTGYGEELIKNAFRLDAGIVETMAHLRATRHFEPAADFILDIGGQDIKCFGVKGGAIDSIMLNEACSSGCGSFLETFARSMGYTAQEFATLGLMARHPADLGSRCTVFMNSSVKQAQKEGAGVDDISAGLSISVVKNAIYKVIRARAASELGSHIVVQGGTFLSDAVLRAFELELGGNVTRPAIAGLMGAYGAALYAKELGLHRSSILSAVELDAFTRETRQTRCGLCANRCALTVSRFPGGRFISGNKCTRPLGGVTSDPLPNLYRFKYDYIRSLPRIEQAPRGEVGIPLGLSNYELLPFWNAFFAQLGARLVPSGHSSPALYDKGRYAIPSDTVCYPAKLMHGHMEALREKGVPVIFYPCMSYNFDEARGDNHYNCPVVAYAPELLRANTPWLNEVTFLCPEVGPHRPRDFERHMLKILRAVWPDLTAREVKAAADAAYAAKENYHAAVRAEGERAVAYARAHGHQLIVLAGRPYHIDPEVNHGIPGMIEGLGCVVVSEDAVADLVPKPKVDVLNQWTYHSRLYAAAKYCAENPDAELVQLVSFGCGLDAITTDEVAHILEASGKLYTQIKIDEIASLGPAKIRIRSLLAAAQSARRRTP